MPIFEYKCAKCGYIFEELIIRSSDGEELLCPACGAKKPERVLSTFSGGASKGSSTSHGGCNASSGFS